MSEPTEHTAHTEDELTRPRLVILFRTPSVCPVCNFRFTS
jgi:hypothetical protein